MTSNWRTCLLISVGVFLATVLEAAGPVFRHVRFSREVLQTVGLPTAREEQRLRHESGSDAPDVDAYVTSELDGGYSVTLRRPLRLGLSVTGPTFWFVNRQQLTIKAVALTGDMENDAIRLAAEYSVRGRTVNGDQLRERVATTWDRHLRRLRGQEQTHGVGKSKDPQPA